MRKQRVRASVELRCRDDIVARLGQRQYRVVNCRHARAHRKTRDATFHCRHALFKHVVGWIHYAAVNIAGHSKVKKVSAMLCIIELVSDCLKNRHGYRFSRRVGCVTGVNGDGFFFHGEGFLIQAKKI